MSRSFIRGNAVRVSPLDLTTKTRSRGSHHLDQWSSFNATRRFDSDPNRRRQTRPRCKGASTQTICNYSAAPYHGNTESVVGCEPQPIPLPDALPIALVNASLSVGAKQMFDKTLGTGAEFLLSFLQARKCYDVKIGQWRSVGTEMKRLVEYTAPVKKNALGPSEAACIEEYTVICREDGGWLVSLKVLTPKVPFSDSFHQSLQWACRHEGQGMCRLRITGQVNFTKACFVKGIIQKASEEGMKEAYQLYIRMLEENLKDKQL